MKKSFLVTMVFIFSFVFSQEENIGYIVEHNQKIKIEYIMYNPPLRINKVDNQKDINYSQIEGLLQSYLSADNLEWAKSEYIDKNDPIVRDETHFEAVKKRSIDDYIQFETAYIFSYQAKKYAFVKYSLIFEKLPFPWTSLMVLEKQNDRWYISKLINQNQILSFLGNLRSNIIAEILTRKSADVDTQKIINENSVNNLLSIQKISLYIENLDEKLKNKLYDERIMDSEVDFRNASLNSKKESFKAEVYHPFLIERFLIEEYEKTEKGLLKSEKTIEKYKKTPEILFLKEQNPTDFISKITIQYEKEGIKDHYIKYRQQNKENIAVVRQNNDFQIIEQELITGLKNVFIKYDTQYLENLIKNPKKEFVGNSGGINIDELIQYMNNHKK